MSHTTSMGENRTSVLIIEDDVAIAKLISFSVKQAGWLVFVAHTVKEGWNLIQTNRPHVIVLDWALPDQTGIALITQIRADRQLYSLPVIMLSARSMEEDKISGLDHGVDDYMTKPFSPRELISRIKALLRRHHVKPAILRAGIISLDPSNYSVFLQHQKIEMNHAEYRLLKFFMHYPEHVFSRSQLLDKVWGEHVAIEERTVDVHVLRLRKTLGEAGGVIRTVRSMGYMLSLQ